MPPLRLLGPPALALVLLGAVACDDCGSSGPRVPFGVDAGTAEPETDPRRDPDPEPFEAREGQAFPEGTTRVAIEGAPIELAEGEVRGVLAVDLDGDGDRDALMVGARDGAAGLWHARREGAAFEPPRELTSRRPPEEGCTIGRVTMRTVSHEHAIASLERTCPGGAAQSLWVMSLEATPRLRERVTLLPEEGRAAGVVRIGLRARDQDGDGHTDVLLDVSVSPLAHDAGEPATATITWLDRPGGLARDTSEPEASVAALAQQAKQALRGDPDSALLAARRALLLHAVLCREAGAPRVRFGDAEGLPCRASEGAGRAAAVAAAALANKGEIFAALEAAAALADPAYRVPAADRRAAEQALAGLAVTEGIRVLDGPAAISPAAPGAHLPLVGFRDDDTLVVRGVAPAVYRVSDEGLVPHPAQTTSGDLLLTDPAGRFAVVGVHRTCEGHVLRIVRASEVVAGVIVGRPTSEPLLEGRAPPPGASCPDLPAAARDDAGGWHVVGWAPQGVVAVRRDEVRLVPLTVDGVPAGEPTVLEPGTPPPAPLPPGRMSPDGAAYVVSTPAGLVVRRLTGDGPPVIVRPPGLPPGLDDVAVSPSGARVAFALEGRVHLVLLP